jgi:hypothetical protein
MSRGAAACHGIQLRPFKSIETLCDRFFLGGSWSRRSVKFVSLISAFLMSLRNELENEMILDVQSFFSANADAFFELAGNKLKFFFEIGLDYVFSERIQALLEFEHEFIEEDEGNFYHIGSGVTIQAVYQVFGDGSEIFFGDDIGVVLDDGSNFFDGVEMEHAAF